MADLKRILFVIPYPIQSAPSQRFRFEQYFKILLSNGYTFKTSSFLNLSTWNILYKPGHIPTKVLGIVTGFLKRFFLLFTLYKYNFIFIHREATPIGPPWFEFIAAKILNKKIIYDFDDAIWIPNTSKNNKIASGLKCHEKVKNICSWAYKVSCGNAYLREYAYKFNLNSYIIPTTIDTENLHNSTKYQSVDILIIGWTGTHSTLKYLDKIIPVIQELEKKHFFKFVVISNHKPNYQLKSLIYVPWSKETEIEDLLTFNIGLMPLEDDPWANGKCAFKALQYMALGIPALVSPVGMNKEVVKHGINGFLCTTSNDWYTYIEKLLLNEKIRSYCGKNARLTIEQNYSVLSNTTNFLDLF